MKAVFYSILLIVLLTVISTAATLQLLNTRQDLSSCITDRSLTERRLQDTQVELDATKGQLHDLILRYENDSRQRDEETRALKDQLRTAREDTARAKSELKESERRYQSLLAQSEREQDATPRPTTGITPAGSLSDSPATVVPYLLAAAGSATLTLFGLVRRLINRRPAVKMSPLPIMEEETISIRMSREQLTDYIRWRRQHDRD